MIFLFVIVKMEREIESNKTLPLADFCDRIKSNLLSLNK